MSEEEEQYKSSKICWICKILINDDDEKVRDHCHVTGKFRGAAHWSCNINKSPSRSSSNISQFKRLQQSFNF